MTDEPPYLTHATGAPVSDNLNIQTAGRRGPALLQDIWLIEKLAHFDREVIPERRMHAKGSGAHGTFTVTHDITRYTKARIFSEIGKQTPMFARFSTVAGERGAADAERDIRGFALKFYTEEGNWDMVGNNTPVFFFRDPLRFPDLNHAIKRDPRTGLRSADTNWDFWTLLPEALHQVIIVMSDRGIPKTFRHMHGFGSHTFSMINAANERVWVKFHFRTQQGIENLTDEDAAAVVANDRESHGRDLLTAIESANFPRWTLSIKVMTEAQARTHKHNPFDLTKVWPKADYPLIEVGVMELNRYPDNYFAEVEQAAFSPAQAEHDVRQRQGRRPRRQGPALPSWQFLQRDPGIRLARMKPAASHSHRYGHADRVYDRKSVPVPVKRRPVLPGSMRMNKGATLKGPQERHQILLLLRRQLCAEDQVEELDGVFQRQKTLVMQVGRVVLGAAQRKGFDRPVADGHHVVDHHRLEEALGLEVVHQVVGVERRLVADRALTLAEEDLLATHLGLCRFGGIELA